MAKIVLLAVAVIAALWLLRGLRRKRRRSEEVRPGAPGERMERCARCGIHLPRSEGILIREQFFCSAEHEREHRESS